MIPLRHRPSRPTTFLALGAALVSLVACRSTGASLCTENLVPGIVVAAKDAATGFSLGAGISGTITEGSFSEELTDWTTEGGIVTSIAGAFERAGDYALEVTHEGYHPVILGRVQVLQGECHVKTVSLLLSMVAE